MLRVDVINYLGKTGICSASQIAQHFKDNQSTYKKRQKETIRQKLVELANPTNNKVRLVYSRQSRSGELEKCYSLTTSGAKEYLKNTQKNLQDFWNMLILSSDTRFNFIFKTKKHSKKSFPSKFNDQYIVNKPKNNMDSFNTIDIIKYYEKNILNVSSNSFLSADLKQMLSQLENPPDLELSICNEISEMPEQFSDTDAYTSKEIKKIITKNFLNILNDKKILKQLLTAREFNFKNTQKLSKIYSSLYLRTKYDNLFLNEKTPNNEEFLKTILGMSKYQRLSIEQINQTITKILIIVSQNNKFTDEQIIKQIKHTNHEKWEYERILSDMYVRGLLLHNWNTSGYTIEVSQFGFLLLVWKIFNELIEIQFEKYSQSSLQKTDELFDKIENEIPGFLSKTKKNPNWKPKLTKKQANFIQKILPVLQDPYEKELPMIIHYIRLLISVNKDLFPRIFRKWDFLNGYILDDSLLKIFGDFYFSKDKFWLFPEKRQVEIDLLTSLQYIEPTYRKELENFFHAGISVLKQWIRHNHIRYPIFEPILISSRHFNSKFTAMMHSIDFVHEESNEFEINDNDNKIIKNFKSEIQRILKLHCFPDPKFYNFVLSETLSYIPLTFAIEINEFFKSLTKRKSDEIKKITKEIEHFVINITKIYSIKDILNHLVLLDKMLSKKGGFFGSMDRRPHFENAFFKYQSNSIDDYVGFQFYTSLMSRDPEIWSKVMKSNEDTKKWYLEKLREINQIDKLRFTRNLQNQETILKEIQK